MDRTLVRRTHTLEQDINLTGMCGDSERTLEDLKETSMSSCDDVERSGTRIKPATSAF